MALSAADDVAIPERDMVEAEEVMDDAPVATFHPAHAHPIKEKTQKRVAIVGAGASGLAACKHALERGLRPVVFQSSNAIGSVWARALASTCLQTPHALYEFSNFPWSPEVAKVFPDHAQAAAYLRSYAERFDMLERVPFGCRVTTMEYAGVREEEVLAWDRWAGEGSAFGTGRGQWRLTMEQQGGGDVEI
ncbi:probable flavin-containing monooxygenase 1 [Triticum dicoccoides]|uniref:probable flavin-containing monooxygenase 1 n=1 Tax=Triticum dicoccoides TaxID=85692 RepID=UPI001891664A|nr:probable flavin-containing monooxygenase 1 [Triticum dicoccoides]